MSLIKKSAAGIVLALLTLSVFSSTIFCQNGRLILASEDISHGDHHLDHYKTFSKYTSGYNLEVLRAIDSVQKHALDGGTYFIGLKANPPESPVNYELKLAGKSLVNPPRKSSYCSGSTYAAFMETLNLIFGDSLKSLSPERFEALRMQEPDGSRREDWNKFWGIWNADGFGSYYALMQYSDIGEPVKPEDARPGDFANLSWTSGNGHSVIILGWHYNEQGEKMLLYWSSQTGTNGYGDQSAAISRIAEMKVVRLKHPGNIFNFDITSKASKSVAGDKTGWE
ncbi:MAG: hypothetical protein ACM3SM_14360 [Bacteroidota bacterium]